MFSALTQGSLVYILDKTSEPSFKVGEVVGVSFPKLNYGQTLVDLKVKVEDEIKDFPSIPSINSMFTYNNGKIVISETKQGIQNEVEGILQNSRQILENIDSYQKNVEDCESILKQLNPQFAKDKERDERLSSLESKFGSFESKLDEIFNFIKK